MANWRPCGYGIIIGDIVRWTEPVWIDTEKGKIEAGMRRVTAKVIALSKMGADMSVTNCVVLSPAGAAPIGKLKRGSEIRRKPRMLYASMAERLPWGGKNGESDRALAVSRFLRIKP